MTEKNRERGFPVGDASTVSAGGTVQGERDSVAMTEKNRERGFPAGVASTVSAGGMVPPSVGAASEAFQ